MSKRANGEGSVYKVGKQWRAVITVGYTSDGRRIRRSKLAPSQKAAKDELAALRNKLDAGTLMVEKRPTVAKFLKAWLSDVVRIELEQNTHVSYSGAVTNHITPILGEIQLDQLSPMHVQEFISKCEKKRVGSRTRQLAFTVLGAAMSHAMKLGMINSNPTAPIRKPRHQRRKIFPLVKAEVKQIFKETGNDRMHAAYVLAATTGVRQCELFGLKWGNVDLKAESFFIDEEAVEICGKVVVKAPKSRASVRTIELSPRAVKALKERRKAAMKEGNAGADLVFPAPQGGYIHRTTFNARVWKPLLKLLEIEHRGFHHMRHTYATHAISAGVPIKRVSEVLGHSRPSITMDVYAQYLDTDQSASKKAMTRLFG